MEPYDRCLTTISAALAQVVDTPAWSLTDEALVDRISATLAVSAGVDELLARLVGSALERELARLAGASSPTAWLASTHGLSRGAAAGIVARARAVNDTVETTRQAWAAGRLSTEQAVLIAETVTGLGGTVDLAAQEQAEVYLIEQAPRFSYPELRHLANHVIEVVDPDGAAVLLAPPPPRHRRMGHRHGRRRHPRGHPTATHRPNAKTHPPRTPQTPSGVKMSAGTVSHARGLDA